MECSIEKIQHSDLNMHIRTPKMQIHR